MLAGRSLCLLESGVVIQGRVEGRVCLRTSECFLKRGGRRVGEGSSWPKNENTLSLGLLARPTSPMARFLQEGPNIIASNVVCRSSPDGSLLWILVPFPDAMRPPPPSSFRSPSCKHSGTEWHGHYRGSLPLEHSLPAGPMGEE